MNSRYIAFHYVLKNHTGETLDESTGDEPLSYIEGESQIIPGLEKQIAPLKKGDKIVTKGRARNVEAVELIHLGSTLVRLQLQVKG